MSDLDEMLVKVQQYKAKLNVIDKALQDRPKDDSLVKLRKDIVQVIEMTEQLYNVRKAKAQTDKPRQTILPQKVEWEQGDVCMAKWTDGRWYFARIMKLGMEDEIEVCYLEYGNTWTPRMCDVKPLNRPESDILVPGATCKVLYEDGLAYGAQLVRSSGLETYIVKFDQEEIEREVSIIEILAAYPPKKRKATEIDQITADDLVNGIPQVLHSTQGDTDADIDSKNTRTKSMKGKKKAKMDAEHVKKQNSWQQFRSGTGSSRRAGFFSTTHNSSIFKSPDNVDGRVGVTGSGRPMTTYKSMRKHKFESIEDHPDA